MTLLETLILGSYFFVLVILGLSLVSLPLPTGAFFHQRKALVVPGASNTGVEKVHVMYAPPFQGKGGWTGKERKEGNDTQKGRGSS